MKVTTTDYGSNDVYYNVKAVTNREYTLILIFENGRKLKLDGVETFVVESERGE